MISRCRSHLLSYGVHRALFVALLAIFSVPAESAPNRDMRVVIDISGSMKETDPNNLRAPALRLLTELLSKGTQAGVWTFGQWTNMLVNHGKVDHRWKELAKKESAKINSVALFTDIGQALDKASRSWKKPDDTQQRTLILLTDGRVDISKEARKNATARQYLLGPILKRLKAMKVKLYPIGLSDNVDSELLESLAKETQGLFQTARTADDLYRVFVNILEESTQANSLPIQEGGFLVDPSVEELNIVVFRATPEQRIALRDPKGKEIDKGSAAKEIRWHEESGYAVITVPDPDDGRWQILTAQHPDNRVFVVSSLRIGTNEIPQELVAGEELKLELSIADGDKPLADEKLLDLIQTQAALEHENGHENVFALKVVPDGVAPGAGQFAGRAVFHQEAGLASVLLTAEGPTFHRSVRRIVRLSAPLLGAVWRGPSFTGVAGTIELEALAQGEGTAPVSATVLWEGPGVTRSGFETQVPAGGSRTLLFAPEHDGRYTAKVVALALAPSGREVLVHLPPLTIDVVPKPAEKPKPEPRILIPAPEPQKLPPAMETQPQAAESGVDKKWLIVGGIANLILILAAFIYYRLTCRREAKAMQERIDSLEEQTGATA